MWVTFLQALVGFGLVMLLLVQVVVYQTLLLLIQLVLAVEPLQILLSFLQERQETSLQVLVEFGRVTPLYQQVLLVVAQLKFNLTMRVHLLVMQTSRLVEAL